MDTNRIQIHQLQDFLLSPKVQEAHTCFVILPLFISLSPTLGTAAPLIPWAGRARTAKLRSRWELLPCSGKAGSSPSSGAGPGCLRLHQLSSPYSVSWLPGSSFAAASLKSQEDFRVSKINSKDCWV